MDDTISKLLVLSKKKHKSDGDLKQFQEFVENLNYEEMEDILSHRILNFDAPQILNSIFTGLSSKNSSQKKRIKVFEHVFKELQTKEVPHSVAAGLISWLAVELEKMTVTHLVRICDLCIEYIPRSESPLHTSWKEIIPKVLSLLVDKQEVDHYGSEMSGEKYKSEVVTAVVQAKWNKPVLTSLADMFRHIPLSTEEHSRVLSKLLSSIDDLEPSELPPLVHNLLLFCKSHGLVSLLFVLNEYYQRHHYSKPASSAEIERDRKETEESECVVLYHLRESCKEQPALGLQLVRAAKISLSAPHLWLSPFLLAALLCLSELPQMLDMLKGMVLKLLAEEETIREFAWLRKLNIPTLDPEEIFTKLIKSAICGQEGVLDGLLALGIRLLGKVGKRVARLGRMIVVNLASRHPYLAGHLITTLVDAIISDPNLSHLSDCFCELCDTEPLLVLEYFSSIGRLLEELPSLPLSAAYRLTSAMVPLFKVSVKVRDSLILVLRKALFAHNVYARKVAVIGFLQLLKRMKMKGFQNLSQNSFQIYTCPSIFTQSAIQVHSQAGSGGGASTNNEGICLEVVNVLKRCFVQQVEVKLCLYEGVARALCHNPELCLPTSEIFIAHLRQYYEPDPTVLPPLRITDAILIANGAVVVQEALGPLVFVVQQIINTTEQLSGGLIENEEYTESREKIFSIMDSLAERFALCTPKTLHLEEETDDELEEVRKEEILKQSLGIAEALIAYFLWKWDLSVTLEKSTGLLALYRAHSALLDFAKEFKTQKKENKDKKTQTQKKVGAPKKSQFVTPPSILDFETIHRFLSLLLCESVEWCTDEVCESLRSRRPLHRYAITCCGSVLARTRAQLSHYKPRSALNSLITLGKLLFDRVMKEIPKLMEFDPATAVLGVESFTEVFSLISEFFPSQLSKFLSDIVGQPESDGLNSLLEKVVKGYLKSLGKILDLDDEEEDAHHKKLMSALISGVSIVCLQLPATESCILKVTDWLTEVVEKRMIPSLSDTKLLLNLLVTLSHRTKPESPLYDNLALHLASLYSTINEVEVEKAEMELAVATEENKALILPLLCSSLRSRLTSLDWLLARVRAEYSFHSLVQLNSANNDYKTSLKEKERELVVQSGFVTSTAQILSSVECPSSGELLCRTLVQLYSLLSGLTKYFMARSTHVNPAYQEARFGKLVKLAASHLSSQLADFILFIESLDSVGEERSKKISNKVLREAKKQADYIPKLVIELENFSKCVTQLSVKCKDPSLATNMKLTTTRDFRLNTRKVEELMKEQLDQTETGSTVDVDESVSSVSSERPKRGRKRKTPQSQATEKPKKKNKT